MIIEFRSIVGGAAGAAMMLAASGAAASDKAQTHRVVIDQFAFAPAVLTIRPGDTVEWINTDLAPHTATAAGGSWDVGSLTRRETGAVTFRSAGHHRYLCLYHPNMVGTIIVSTDPE